MKESEVYINVDDCGSSVAMGNVNSHETQQMERRGIRPPIALIVVSYASPCMSCTCRCSSWPLYQHAQCNCLLSYSSRKKCLRLALLHVLPLNSKG